MRAHTLLDWSLGLAVAIPYIGLPMSIFTLYKIWKSQGQLKGKGIALAALLVSVVLLAAAIVFLSTVGHSR